MSLDADVCHSAAGKLGPIWKRFRKKLPPVVRDHFAELLLELRHFVLPAELLSPTAAIGASRYDIRGIAELLRYVSTRDESIAHTAIPNYPPPPPPPTVPGLDKGVHCSELEAFRQSWFLTGHAHMATNGSIDIDDSVFFELSKCDVQYGGCEPDLEEKFCSPAGLPCVLFDDAAATAELTMSEKHGNTTCVQPEGSIADGPINFGLEEDFEPMADTTEDPKATMAVISEPAIIEVAFTSEPAIGLRMKRYSFKRSYVQNVFTYCWEQDKGEVDITFSPALTPCQAKHIRVVFERQELSIACEGVNIFSGSLFGPIQQDECSWCITNGKLQVTVFIVCLNPSVGLFLDWPRLVGPRIETLSHGPRKR